MDVIDETKAIMRARKGEWIKIARDSGVGYEWIRKLMQEAIEDPGYRRISKLHSFLKKDQLAA